MTRESAGSRVSREQATATVWDVAVIGAGPAGAVAALELSTRGYSVLLLERLELPRDKVCGDGLLADSLRVLQRIGLLQEIRSLAYTCRRLRVYSPRRIAFELGGDFLALKRATLDARLAGEAVARGARLCIAEAIGVGTDQQGTAWVTLRDVPRPVRARVAVVATGARTTLLRDSGMLLRPRASAIALRCYLRSPAALDEWVVSFDRSIVPGYGWIFPVAAGEYNIGCGVFYDDRDRPATNLRRLFESFLEQFPPARRLRTAGCSLGPLEGAQLRCGLDGASFHDGGQVVAAGEAVGSTLHLTGEGIGKAMETGELAAAAIDEALSTGDPGRLGDYPDRVVGGLSRIYRGFRTAQGWISRGWVADLTAARLAGSRRLRGRLEGVLDETVAPEELLSPRGLVAWRR